MNCTVYKAVARADQTMRALERDELCGRSSAFFEAGRPRRNVEFAAGERGREMSSLLLASKRFKKEYVINALKIN
jgi:hypothetical protein